MQSRHLALGDIDSTNAEALRRARAGETGSLWITAKTQSAGRGRGGKTWVSPPGNLYATLLLNQPSAPQLAPQLAFVAGLAVRDAITALLPNLAPSLRLKWPNDLLLNGKKLSGVLIEAENMPVFAAAIGIGVNCASHPDDTSYPATDLNSALTPDALFAALSAAMEQRLAQWQGGANFAAVRADWLASAAGIGKPIKVRLPDREVAGQFQAVDETGRLLVEAGGQIETISAGEVFAVGEGR